jgi:acetolactate synthase I/II/III large subunit
MDKSPAVNLNSTSHYFLEGLNEIGVDYLFCNLGTDHAPLIEEMARWRKAGLRHPPTVLCPHENVTVHMAAGYTMVTGRGQAALVHVDCGTANSAMALHNLCRARIPLILMAGRAPYTVRGELAGSRDNYVHFIQEPFDQAALVRPYVKWEYDLHAGVTTKEVLRRAHSVAHSDPMGPVYLTLPRETLSQSWDKAAVQSFPDSSFGPVRARGTDPATVTQIVDRLLAAEYPVLITRSAGRNLAAPALIDALAQFAGIRVFESGATHLSIAHDSPCYLGVMTGPAVPKADLGLMIDVEVPWIPADVRERAGSCWIQIDVDPLKENTPLWGFPSQLRIQGDSTVILGQVLEALRAKATPKFFAAAKARLATITAESAARAASLASLAADRGSAGGINANFLCAEVSRSLEPEDLVFNEGIRNTPTIFNQVMRTRPGSIFGMPGSALGFSGGFALGAKLARRDALAVQLVGDGSFYQCTPETVYAVARQYELPIMTVVLDNGGWSAVKESTLRMYPKGEAAANAQFQSRLSGGMDFGKVVESAGGFGVRIDHPNQVRDALQACIRETKSGRSSLLHAVIQQI